MVDKSTKKELIHTGMMGNVATTPEEVIRNWAQQNGQTPALFSRVTGYSYIHAWNLLRGHSHITFETLGRMAVGYGPQAIEPLVQAMRLSQEAARCGSQ
jgi:hypothetical protein